MPRVARAVIAEVAHHVTPRSSGDAQRMTENPERRLKMWCIWFPAFPRAFEKSETSCPAFSSLAFLVSKGYTCGKRHSS
jgi:hypothetical protein